MDKDTLDKLRRLVDEAIYAPTKNDAKDPIKRLELMAAGLRKDLNGYLDGKLDEIIGYAKEASGQARNKEHWISMVNQSWAVFEGGLKK